MGSKADREYFIGAAAWCMAGLFVVTVLCAAYAVLMVASVVIHFMA